MDPDDHDLFGTIYTCRTGTMHHRICSSNQIHMTMRDIDMYGSGTKEVVQEWCLVPLAPHGLATNEQKGSLGHPL